MRKFVLYVLGLMCSLGYVACTSQESESGNIGSTTGAGSAQSVVADGSDAVAVEFSLDHPPVVLLKENDRFYDEQKVLHIDVAELGYVPAKQEQYLHDLFPGAVIKEAVTNPAYTAYNIQIDDVVYNTVITYENSNGEQQIVFFLVSEGAFSMAVLESLFS